MKTYMNTVTHIIKAVFSQKYQNCSCEEYIDTFWIEYK